MKKNLEKLVFDIFDIAFILLRAQNQSDYYPHKIEKYFYWEPPQS
jgi:hypothetical protein